MPKQTLTCDTLGDLDSGALRIAVNQALNLMTKDLADRPALGKVRRMILCVEMKPVVDTNSNQPQLESTDSSWHVKVSAPAIGSSGLVMKPNAQGQLYFHSDLPEEPDNETIMDEAERRRKERGE